MCLPVLRITLLLAPLRMPVLNGPTLSVPHRRECV